MSANLTLSVKSIKSLNDSTEANADEPYVLVTAVNLVPLIAQVEVTLYGPWSDVEKGETHGTLVLPPNLPQPLIDFYSTLGVVRRPFWSLNNKTPAVINHPSEVIFIASVMENDDGKPDALRTLVKVAAVASLAGSVGVDRATRVEKIITDIGGALVAPTGGPNFDDVVGRTQELRLDAADLIAPASGTRVKTLTFAGGNEGTFQVAFEMMFAK